MVARSDLTQKWLLGCVVVAGLWVCIASRPLFGKWYYLRPSKFWKWVSMSWASVMVRNGNGGSGLKLLGVMVVWLGNNWCWWEVGLEDMGVTPGGGWELFELHSVRGAE